MSERSGRFRYKTISAGKFWKKRVQVEVHFIILASYEIRFFIIIIKKHKTQNIRHFILKIQFSQMHGGENHIKWPFYRHSKIE